MKILLSKGDARAGVDTSGAVVTQYSVAGRDVLFPRQEIDGKMRGGSHVCAPYFGPGALPDQPQHGYARTVEWAVKEQFDDMIVLSHHQTEGEYAGLELELRYQLEKDSLEMELLAHNTSTQPLRLTPGFHPYFSCPEPVESIVVNGEVYEAAALAGTVYRTLDSGRAESEVAGQNYLVATDTLREFALWTAHPHLYVCIEPTLAGNSFSERHQGSDAEYIAPGSTAHYGCRVASY